MLLFTVSTALITSSLIQWSQGTKVDTENSFKGRLSHLQDVCKKYNDSLRYEYDDLFGGLTNNDIFWQRLTAEHINNYFVCSVEQISYFYWGNIISSTLLNHCEEYGDCSKIHEIVEEKIKEDTNHSLFKSYTGVLAAVHPFKMVLAHYIQSFVNNAEYDVGKAIFEIWLKPKNNKFLNEGEKQPMNSGYPTLTFRQFINFLTNCDVGACASWFSRSTLKGFEPVYYRCHPCRLDKIPYKYIIKGWEDSMAESEVLLEDMGVKKNMTVYQDIENGPYFNRNNGHYKEDIIKKYYSQLYKHEIFELYLKYKLDFELFGYSPDEILAYGMDSP